ncbi:MAG TPA: type II toxin-antitoxin system MqsA family antitoxin [Polyangiaceae bacterium]|nr:type II toxin-antitoxin system MqsA family antitoxin [Polyangiaceae bacterium]
MSRPTRNHRPGGARPTAAIANDACPSCGTAMKETRGRLAYPVNGEDMKIAASHLRCSKCGEVVLRLEDARRLRADAIGAYRKKYRLLSADEIRAVREHHGLTQAELAKLLHLGQNTVSRWEAGRNVQTGAMDVLLRLLRDVPGTLGYLKALAA